MGKEKQVRKWDDAAIKLVGRNIARYRSLKGLSQRRLGILCDIDNGKISVYERGLVDINISTLSAISKALAINIVQLFEDYAE